MEDSEAGVQQDLFKSLTLPKACIRGGDLFSDGA